MVGPRFVEEPTSGMAPWNSLTRQDIATGRPRDNSGSPGILYSLRTVDKTPNNWNIAFAPVIIILGASLVMGSSTAARARHLIGYRDS